MSLQHAYVVEHGRVIPQSELSPQARATIERMARCAYLIDRHRDPPAGRATAEHVVVEARAA